MRPGIIATLGRSALVYFIPKAKITELHGRAQTIERNGTRLPLVPMYHPAAALHQPEASTVVRADVILWCTGFRSSLDHLAPLRLRGPGGGITMTGRLATQVAGDARVHLVGYGPSASTIGANRAGRAAARELTQFLKQ